MIFYLKYPLCPCLYVNVVCVCPLIQQWLKICEFVAGYMVYCTAEIPLVNFKSIILNTLLCILGLFGFFFLGGVSTVVSVRGHGTDSLRSGF